MKSLKLTVVMVALFAVSPVALADTGRMPAGEQLEGSLVCSNDFNSKNEGQASRGSQGGTNVDRAVKAGENSGAN